MTTNNKQVFRKKQLAMYIKMASGLSLMMGAAAMPAFAQEAAEDQVEEVVVTGQRASIQSAQMIKRDSEVVVDSVTAVDIGALPDRSVSEALQRIPGVQLQRTNAARDPARLAAEGGAVFVRGLSWVRTELNGRDIFSATSGRSLGFEDISADMMVGLDVYKSPTAEMVEGGIGGTINLRTRRPFDSPDMILAGSVDYNYAELYEEGFPSFNALYSDRWETGVGEFGFLISASMAEIGNRTDSIQTGRYEAHDVDPDGDVTDYRYLPTGLGFRRIDWEQERNAFATAMQWAPNDELTLSLQILKAEANPVDVERAVGVNTAWGGNLNPGSGNYTYDDEGFLFSGVLDNAALGFNTRYGSRESETNDYAFNFEYTPDDHWEFSGDVQYVESTADVLSMTAFTYLGGPGADENSSSGVDVRFDFGGVPSMEISNPEHQAAMDQYWWGAAMDHIEANEADSMATRLDAEYKFDDASFVKSFAFGVRATDKDTLTRQSGWNWGYLSNQFWRNNPDATSATLDDYAADQSELYVFDNFFGGDLSAPGVGWFAKEGLVDSTAGAYEHLEQTKLTNWGWDGWAPLNPATAYDSNPREDNVSAGVNKQNEKTNAAYFMVRFGEDSGDVLGVPFDGNIGVRVVQTDTTAWGKYSIGGVGSCTVATPDCVGANAFVADYMAQHGDYRSYKNSYTNALPSLNLRFMVTDEVQMRFAASRTLVRPDFHQTRPYTSLNFDFEGDAFDDEVTSRGVVGTGNGGSPSLKPAISDQIDLSAEYYFSDAGSLTLSLFHKSLEDYAVAATVAESHTYGGYTYDFEVTRQLNGSTGKLKGFEIAYSQFFNMLPEPFDGLGVQANYTYIHNKGGSNVAVNVFDVDQVSGATNEALPIEGMSKTSYNLALMYEKYGVSARLAYNWRERYLLTTSAANIERPVWFNDYGQLDTSVFYTVNDHLKVGLQVTNLLEERTLLEVGDTQQAGDYSWTQGDRRMAFVVRGQF